MIGQAQQLHIVHVVCTDSFAGVERYVATLSQGLARSNCRVTVLGGDERLMRPLLAPDDIEWLPSAGIAAAVRRLVMLRDVDLIHAHLTAAEFAAVTAAPILRAPVVTTRHIARTRGSSGVARRAGKVAAARIAAQISVSKFVARSIDGPSTVIHTGVANVAGDSVRADRTVLVVSRLEQEKRVDLALDAWQHSGLGRRSWRLQIAGDGSRRRELEDRARALGVADSARFLGIRHDIDALMQRADILLSTCPVEAFGLAVVEAMAAALPVVAVTGGAHDETVGLAADAGLYPASDPARGGQILAALAGDERARHEYGTRLREVQRREFTVDLQVDRTLDLYRSVLR